MPDKMPACPKCGSRKRVIPAGDNVHTFACLTCQCCFEDVDDSDIGYGDPARYAERREEFAIREKARRERMQRR